MLSRKLLKELGKSAFARYTHSQNPKDALEQAYYEKVQEYENKSSGGKIVDPSPEILNELKTELALVSKKYGFKDPAESEKFPALTFEEPVIDRILEDIANEDLFK